MYPPQAHAAVAIASSLARSLQSLTPAGWEIKECKGADSTHAAICSLFTYPNGYQPLLDCAEEDLPEWTRAKQLSLESLMMDATYKASA